MQPSKRFQAALECAPSVERRHHNRHPRRALQWKVGGRLVLALDRIKGVLRSPVARRQSKSPIRNLHSAAKPIVRVTKNDRPRQARAASQLDLPIEELALPRLAFAD